MRPTSTNVPVIRASIAAPAQRRRTSWTSLAARVWMDSLEHYARWILTSVLRILASLEEVALTRSMAISVIVLLELQVSFRTSSRTVINGKTMV